MRIGIDIDGTITRSPKFFAILSAALVSAGHHVVVVTYRLDRELTENELNEYGVQYHEMIMPSSYDHEIADWKINAYGELELDIVFEDMLEVVNGLSSSIVSFIPLCQKQGKLKYS
jgi:hypothetical protein